MLNQTFKKTGSSRALALALAGLLVSCGANANDWSAGGLDESGEETAGPAESARGTCANPIKWLRLLWKVAKGIKAADKIRNGCALLKLVGNEADELVRVVRWDIAQIEKGTAQKQMVSWLSNAQKATISRVKTVGKKTTYRLTKGDKNLGLTVINDGKNLRIFTYGAKTAVTVEKLEAAWAAMATASVDFGKLASDVREAKPTSVKVGETCDMIVGLISPISWADDTQREMAYNATVRWALPKAKALIEERYPNYSGDKELLATWVVEASITGETIPIEDKK